MSFLDLKRIVIQCDYRRFSAYKSNEMIFLVFTSKGTISNQDNQLRLASIFVLSYSMKHNVLESFVPTGIRIMQKSCPKHRDTSLGQPKLYIDVLFIRIRRTNLSSISMLCIFYNVENLCSAQFLCYLERTGINCIDHDDHQVMSINT